MWVSSVEQLDGTPFPPFTPLLHHLHYEFGAMFSLH